LYSDRNPEVSQPETGDDHSLEHGEGRLAMIVKLSEAGIPTLHVGPWRLQMMLNDWCVLPIKETLLQH
jgi:hypothetical protein